MSDKSPWQPYVPSSEAPWDVRRVVHLHRRAGFAATWAEVQRDLKDGPQASVDRLLRTVAPRPTRPVDFDATAGRLLDPTASLEQAKATWVERMLASPDSLSERLTLMWHNHFATSAAKVGRPSLMLAYHDALRDGARGPFRDLLQRMVRNPAVLIFLDAQENNKEHPNENLARELMELFTLGVGNYTEKDIKEAARALTGWSVTVDLIGNSRGFPERLFQEVPEAHDTGDKTILGRTGPWKATDLVEILLAHPATARRLAWRVCEALMGERGVGGPAIDALAAGLREHDLDVTWAVGTVLRSRAFFAPANLGRRVVGPVEYVVGIARALELSDPPNPLLLAHWAARLGQDLFFPPNVGGWPGGRTWLTTLTVIGRANFAAALVEGKLSHPQARWDGLALARKYGRGKDLGDLITFYAELLLGRDPGPAWRQRLDDGLGPKPELTPATSRRAVALLMASPEAQLA